MSALTDKEVDQALNALPGWFRTGKTITRTFEFSDFVAAMKFVNGAAELAEAANHHPDIDIRYSKVKVALTSHDSGGVTDRDVKMAKKISELK